MAVAAAGGTPTTPADCLETGRLDDDRTKVMLRDHLTGAGQPASAVRHSGCPQPCAFLAMDSPAA